MAIFIIDQLSLNTDLPLDFRYLPIGGRLDIDVSMYKYPGMQVYDTTTESVWHCDNNLNWIELISGTDSSLNNLYDMFNDVSTLVSVHDTSIGDLYNVTSIIDSSIIRIDGTLDTINNLLVIHDASLGSLDIRLNAAESSIGFLTTWNISLDASIIRIDNINDIQGDAISDLELVASIHDASIGDLINQSNIFDSSISVLQNQTDIIDSSILSMTSDISSNTYNISLIDASTGDYVRRDGDTMIGDLVINAGLSVSQDVSITGGLVVSDDVLLSSDVHIGGDLLVDGSTIYFNTTVIDVSSNFINLNQGLTGVPPEWLQSGVIIGRGSEDPYAFIFDETLNTFRIGIVTSLDPSGYYQDTDTQAVATRQDAPIDQGIAYWNSLNNVFNTASNFIYDPSDHALKLFDASLHLDSYGNGTTDLMLSVNPDGCLRATPMPTTLGFATVIYVDGSLAIRDSSIVNLRTDLEITDSSLLTLTNRVNNIDTSISILNIWSTAQDASIINLRTRIDTTDSSLSIISDISETHDTSIGDLYEITSQILHQPFVGDVSIIYANSLASQIVTTNIYGIKIVDFVYDINEDVSVINIDNYGESTREVTFEKDLDDNIIAVHIT